MLLSKDEGQTWKSILINKDPEKKQSFEYPSIIQDSQGNLLMIYSHFTPNGKTMGFARVEADEIDKLFDITMRVDDAGAAVGSTLDMSVGSSKQLIATLSIDNDAGAGDIIWSTDAAGVVIVSQDGKITAQAAGNALISARSVKYGTTFKVLITVK